MHEEQRTGVGGEAQELYSLTESKIAPNQASEKIEGLQVVVILRVPPQRLKEYLSLPVEEVLEFVIQLTSLVVEIFN